MTTKIRTWEIGLNNVLFKKKGSIEELTDASIRKLYLLNYGPNIIAELPVIILFSYKQIVYLIESSIRTSDI